MNKICLYIPIPALLFWLSACTNVATFDYHAAPGTMGAFQSPGTTPKTVAVPPFLDQRGIQYEDPAQAGDHGSFCLGLIPFMPFGYIIKGEPEKTDDFVSLGRFHFDPPNDLANAAAVSLKNSKLFDKVIRANSLRQTDADYIWQGKLLSTRYRGNMYSYCITYFLSPVFWILGAPYGTSWNTLHVQFELLERATGKIIWQYDYHHQDAITHWIYARIGQDVSLYPRLMKHAMNCALRDLAAGNKLKP